VFSAVGILGAPLQVDLAASWPTPLDHTGLAEARDRLAAEARRRLVAMREGAPGDEGGPGADRGSPLDGSSPVEVETTLDCRYAGQSHTLRVASIEAFAAEHARHNGYERAGTPVEVVTVRATARQAAPNDLSRLPAPDRSATVGPTVVAEPDCTIWVPEGWRADVGAAGALVLRRTDA
jgi:N-methylhydantoinase A/oxoprolinase/acetone carboxylase beta subunit